MNTDNTAQKYIVIGVGELLWDILPTGKRAGGAPVNFAFHASQRGAYGCAVSAVGNDALGEELLAELRQHRINAVIEKVDHPTGTVQVELQDGIPQYTIHEDVAWDYIPLTEDMQALARQADVICVGSLGQRNTRSRHTTQTLLGLVSDDAYKLYDINLRQHYYSRELIEETLKNVNVFKINDDEILILKSLFSLSMSDEQACHWFMETFGLKLLIFTAGKRHSSVYSPEGESTIPTPQTDVVDTVGAGDSFSGVLITELLKGASLQEAHAAAVKIAAHVCAHAGAWVQHPDV